MLPLISLPNQSLSPCLPTFPVPNLLRSDIPHSLFQPTCQPPGSRDRATATLPSLSLRDGSLYPPTLLIYQFPYGCHGNDRCCPFRHSMIALSDMACHPVLLRSLPAPSLHLCLPASIHPHSTTADTT